MEATTAGRGTRAGWLAALRLMGAAIGWPMTNADILESLSISRG